MNISNPQSSWPARLIHLANNPLTFIGIVLTTTGGVSWLFVLPVYLGEGAANPYLGILFYLVFPAIFLSGLALMPLGAYVRYRMEQRGGQGPVQFPPISWRNVEFRRVVTFAGIATLANIVIGGHYTYAAVEYMGSVSFCGQTCHTVMQPEFTAYQDSSHFRVSCVECHIGSGASWFVRSKLSGVRQVFANALDTYSKPIPSPVHDLRPARETCEACHWPQKFSGQRFRVIDKFAADEQNTQTKTVLLLHIGGGDTTAGIHGFHLFPGVKIEYRSDPSRQNIPWVRYTDPEGNSTEYVTGEWNPDRQQDLEYRVMDCIDCHNRPTHTFELPGRALDEALAGGKIDPSLPLVKAQALEILKAEYASREDAESRIPSALTDFYRTQHPAVFGSKQQQIEDAARTLLAIYQRNVFPAMKVTWGTYPNHVGHTDFPGCYRCHDEQHASSGGKTISQDCDSCHELLAIEEEKPEILSTLGMGG